MNLFEKAAELSAANTPFAIATIVSSSGSTPRGKAKMIVLADGTSYGTVGGGLVEARVIEESKKAIDFDRPVMLDYTLDHSPGERSLDMECGGSMSVYVEVYCAKPRLLIAGGGHVGLAIARLAAGLGYRIAVVDDRPDFVTGERFPMAQELYVMPDMEKALAAAPSDRLTCAIIATHASDERALRAFVGRDLAYLGFLGSRRKVRVLLDKARDDGVPEELLARVRAPIGLDLGAETPEEIAVSVMAEIMAALAGRDAAPLSGREGDLIVIRGAGDLATGCALRFKAAGFRPVMLEIERPTAIRRSVAFSEAVFDGEARVEGVLARRAGSLREALQLLNDGVVPVLVDPDCSLVPALRPYALVDATLAKRNTGVRRGMAPAVIGLGPGFEAGGDVDAVVETQRGHSLGRVILSGSAAPDSGVPGEIAGKSAERLIKSPAAGELRALVDIGSIVSAGQAVAVVASAAGELRVDSPLDGVLRGLIRSGSAVAEGQKIGDVDPRGERAYCFGVSDKARAVAGGALEAALRLKGRVKR